MYSTYKKGGSTMLGDNIRYLRLKQGLSQEYIAEKLGYKSYTTIQKWESGISEPPFKKMRELSDLFKVDIDDLAYKNLQLEENNIVTHEKNGVTINVLGRVAAGIPINAITEIEDTEEITEELAKSGDFFALRIKGDSMEPKISNGDVVIVRQQDDAETGDIVIAMVNGDDAVCKRLRKYKEGLELISTNPNYAPIYFDDDTIKTKPVRIIGKVVELRAKF
jgi:repressor LexA